MALPLVLIFLAALAAAVVAYGTHPAWGGFEHGLQWIVWSRRLQWPLVTAAILLCLALIGLVILGRRRAWWLIGLGPILALLAHRFAGDAAHGFVVADDPPFVPAAEVVSPDKAAPGRVALGPEDWVVGLTFGETTYAYPFRELFRATVVVQSDRDKRLILLWSAYANRVLAFNASAEVKARDLEVIGTPADALLVYDTRRGQFINGLKGRTIAGNKPAGFGTALVTTKTTWSRWLAANPATKVMALLPPAPGTGRKTPWNPPAGPILPAYRLPGQGDAPNADSRRVTVAGAELPAAVESTDVTAAPINLAADGGPVVLFRPEPGGPPRAFSALAAVKATTQPSASDSPAARLILPQFVRARPDARRAAAGLRESIGGTLWTIDGEGVARTPSAGKRLRPVPADDDVDWDVLRYWYPGLQLRPIDAAPTNEKPERPNTSGPATRRGR